MLFIFDLIAMISAFLAAWFWLWASARQLRRVSRDEVLDAHDLNRIVVAYNRSQLLNGRAALATAVSALAVALRLLAGFFGVS